MFQIDCIHLSEGGYNLLFETVFNFTKPLDVKYFFIDVILPIPLEKTFTYRINEAEADFLKQGMRVAVPFGSSKLYTALVVAIHQNAPELYEAKDIHQILDESPIIHAKQLKFWHWIASYYMCSIGDIYRAALPSAFLIESETIIYKNQAFDYHEDLTDDEFVIVEALGYQSNLTIHQVADILGKKTVLPTIQTLLKKNAIYIKEELFEQYKPKLITYVRLHPSYSSSDTLEELLESLSRAKKQRDVLLHYFQLHAQKKNITVKELTSVSGASQTIVKALVDKEILSFYTLQQDRIQFVGETEGLKALNPSQEQAFQEIQSAFATKDVVLLHGVTSSGKTEIYVKLIQEVLAEGKQALFLLPEIALTTQIITRLESYFGDCISVYHSKYSTNERVEVWNNVLHNKPKAQLILGARSAVFLPFQNLGLLVVDEEHEVSYKQFEPSPRYNARDAAIVLAKQHDAKLILGSATPSLESYYNAKEDKYELVSLSKRFGNVLLPAIELVDLKEKQRKRELKGHFSDVLLEHIQAALDNQEQIILFQNRRGFSPIVECKTCGVSPQCPNCDVSLTYHKYKNQLQCHYCSYQRAMPHNCGACGSHQLDTKGFGTEQIELELKELFPNYKIGRMDLDTTRGKYGYEKIIGAFEAHEIDILVGTQMLSKGLDFSNVSLVGILNADTMLNFPDFRAHERAFQLMVQVSGRAGRAAKQGKVIIQTYNPYHQILQQVSTTDFLAMYKEQLEERWQYHYPPFYRLIKITLKHKDYQKVDEAIIWLAKAMQQVFKEHVLGPATPSISRIRNLHIKNITLKIPPGQSLGKTKEQLQKIKNTFQAVADFRSIRFIIDVDAY